jgi:hypothetical protein
LQRSARILLGEEEVGDLGWRGAGVVVVGEDQKEVGGGVGGAEVKEAVDVAAEEEMGWLVEEGGVEVEIGGEGVGHGGGGVEGCKFGAYAHTRSDHLRSHARPAEPLVC